MAFLVHSSGYYSCDICDEENLGKHYRYCPFCGCEFTETIEATEPEESNELCILG